MRRMQRVMMRAGLLGLALVPAMASVSPEAATSALGPLPSSQMPIAIVHPLAVIERGPLVTISGATIAHPILSESGLLVLVGSVLFGLAAIVRRATRI